VALRFDGASTTWRALDDRIRRLATGLSTRGVVKGDRVAVLMTNRPEFLEAELLTGWLRGRLASYKKPTALVVVAELPRSAAGKVLKHELRRKYGEPASARRAASDLA
jgi:acyl-CoA synthetase (AMP-forming)/AMP-acid ligase II